MEDPTLRYLNWHTSSDRINLRPEESAIRIFLDGSPTPRLSRCGCSCDLVIGAPTQVRTQRRLRCDNGNVKHTI